MQGKQKAAYRTGLALVREAYGPYGKAIHDVKVSVDEHDEVCRYVDGKDSACG